MGAYLWEQRDEPRKRGWQPTGEWLSPNFHLSQFTQWMTSPRPVPADVLANLRRLAQSLEVIQAALGARLSFGRRSGWRPLDVADPGARPGQHTWGKAADFWTGVHTPRQLRDVVEALIRQGRIPDGGVGFYDSSGSRFVHYDHGPVRRWQGDETVVS